VCDRLTAILQNDRLLFGRPSSPLQLRTVVGAGCGVMRGLNVVVHSFIINGNNIAVFCTKQDITVAAKQTIAEITVLQNTIA
jgi:hypothetical protein